jgi:hypothetical protein
MYFNYACILCDQCLHLVKALSPDLMLERILALQQLKLLKRMSDENVQQILY